MAFQETPENSTNGRSLEKKLAPLRALFRVVGSVAPRLAARAANRIFRTVRRHRTPERELAWIRSARSLSVTSGDHQLRAWSWGEGPTILLVHGWEGRGSQMGAFAAPLVEAGFRVVALDAPGHGDSKVRLSSLPEFAQAIRDLAQAVGPVHGLVAHSFGAPGSALALQQGLRLDRLVFVAAPADLEPFTVEFSRLLGLNPRVRSHMMRQIEETFGIAWSKLHRISLQPTDSVELLVVHDRDDPEIPFDNAFTISSRWHASRVLATSGRRHRRIPRDAAVIEGVGEFLKGEPNAESRSRLRISCPTRAPGIRGVVVAGIEVPT